MHFIELSEFDFHARLAVTDGISIVMFSGPGCGACKHLEKHLPAWLAGLADHYYKIDVQRSTALAHAYEVFHLPALFIFIDGQYHGPLHAEASPASLIGALRKLLSEPAHEEP